MNILHSIILFILQLSYVCTTKIEDTSIIDIIIEHFDGGMFPSKGSDNNLNYSGTARMCGSQDMLCAMIIYVAVFYLAPIIIGVGIVIALIAFVVPSVDNESSPRRSFEGSFKRNFFEVGEKLIFSFTNQENLDALTVTVGDAIEEATKRF